MEKKRNVAEATNQLTQTDDTTKMMVLSMLSNEPQDRFVLAGAIGITERTFRLAVHDLRQERGEPVITDPNGGYRFGNRKEVLRYTQSLRSRAYDLLRTARAMEGADPEQITFDELIKMGGTK